MALVITRYAQHVKLITWTFTKSQAQTITSLKRQIRLPIISQPLNEAIPNEKYEDWCKQQADKGQKAIEEEEVRIYRLRIRLDY